MNILDKIKGFFTGGKQRDEHEEIADVPVPKKVRRVQPTCGIYPHKNRRYDGTLRGSIDATKLGKESIRL